MRPRASGLVILLVAVAVLAAAGGAAFAAWVDWSSPNQVYGAQVILLGAAGLVAILGALLHRRGRVGQVLATLSVALLLGTVAGLVLSPPAINESSGTMTLRADLPEALVVSGRAMCSDNWFEDQLDVTGDLGETSPEEPAPVGVYFVEGFEFDDDPANRRDGLFLSIYVGSGEAEASQAGATPDSTLELRFDGFRRTLRFADLVVMQRGSADVPVAGTIEWSCESP